MPLSKTEFQHASEECYKNGVVGGHKSEHRWSCSSSSSGGSTEDMTWEKGTSDLVECHVMQKHQKPTMMPVNDSKANRAANTSMHAKKCLYCGSKSTPMWRRGPQGAGTLCNACGASGNTEKY